MRLLGKLLILLLTFVLGFASAFGALFGVGYYAYKNISLDKAGVNTEAFLDREAAEVQLSALTIEGLLAEIQEVMEITDTLTVDTLVLRYGLILPEQLEANLPESARKMPLKKLLSVEGVTELLDEVYVGQLLGLEKGNPVEGSDGEYYWFEEGGAEASGIFGIFANYTIGGILNEGINFDEIMSELTIAAVLNLEYEDGFDVYVNKDGTLVRVYDMSENIKIWYNSDGTRVADTLSTLAEFGVNELTTAIDELSIGSLLGYTEYAGEYYSYSVKEHDGASVLVLEKASGITSELAHLTVSDFSNGNLDSEIKEIEVASVLGYTYNEDDGKYYNGETEITGVMAVVCGCKVGELDTKLNEVMVGEVCGFTGVPTNEEKTEFIWYSTYSETDPSLNVEASGIMASIASLTINDLKDNDKLVSCIESTTVADALGYENRAGVYYKDGVKVTGVMSVIAGSQLGNIQSAVDDSMTGDLMGLTKDPVTGKWHDKNGEVHVLMNKIASTPFNEISSITNDLTLADILPESQLNSGFISLIDSETNINNIGTEVNRVFDNTTLYSFIQRGVINIDGDTAVFGDENGPTAIGALTLKDLLQKVASGQITVH